LCIAACLAAAGYFIAQNKSVQMVRFSHAQTSRFADAKPVEPELTNIWVTPCGETPCILVQAGGREFIVGAGASVADGLLKQGLLSDKLDGVLLTDLSSEQIEGLIGLRERSLEVGRETKLKVYGASGVEIIVDGMNAMLETSDVERSVRFGQGLLPFDIAPAEAIPVNITPEVNEFFDSGVLQVSATSVSSSVSGAEVVYRFDYEGETLIVGGCGARLADINTALEGAGDQLMIVLPAASAEQLKVIQSEAQAAGLKRESRFALTPVDQCLTPTGLKSLALQTKAKLVVGAPLYPYPSTASDIAMWKSDLSNISEDSDIDLRMGEKWVTQSLAE
jgi:hypothetical protein